MNYLWKLNKIGEKLAYYLSLKGWSQKQLANKLGTTQQSISRWIKGQTEPSLDDVLLSCYYLDEDPNELLGYNDIDEEEFSKYDEIFECTGERDIFIKTQEEIDKNEND